MEMQIRWILTVGIVVLSFVVVSTTVCPTITFTDNGELAAVAGTLGIAHPTGYPLFTLVGRLIVMAIPSGNTVGVLNYAAAFIGSLAAGALFHLLLALRESRALFGRSSGKQNIIEGSAVIGALAFAFSTTVWAQGIAWEVYGLQLLLLILTTNAFVRGMEEQIKTVRDVSRWLTLAAFLLGLSFANHMTTVLLLPGFAYLFFSTLGVNKKALRSLAQLAPWTFAALSLYLVLPIRSSGGPMLDWGGTADLDRLVRHVTGSQYRVWMFSGAAVMKKQFIYFVTHFGEEFHLLLLPLIGAGVISQVSRSRRYFFFTVVLVLTTLFYATNYDIFDIDSYFLLAYIAVAFWIAAGAEWIGELLGAKGQPRLVLGAMAVCVVGVQVGWNHARADQSENMLVSDAVENVCAVIEPRGMLVTSQWDYVISPLWYWQIIEKKRTDICVVDKNLLMNRPWYFVQIERTYPGIFDSVRVEADAFLRQLLLFERGEPFNPSVIQSRWNSFWGRFLHASASKRPVYADWRLSQEMPRFNHTQPIGILVRYSHEPIQQSEVPVPLYRPAAVRSPLVGDLKSMYVGGALQYAHFLRSFGRIERAQEWQDFALRVDPQNPFHASFPSSPKR